MLTPYQFASNSPIANIDLDGGEAKYYTLQLEKIYNGKGVLTKLVSTLVERKSEESGWHVNGLVPSYKFNGELGDGRLYKVEEKAKIINSNGSSESVTTQIGSIYVPGPKDIEKSETRSPYPVNIRVFGRGDDPSGGGAFAKGGSGKTFSFSLSEWESMTEFTMAARGGRNINDLKLPTSTEFIESTAGFLLDQDINKLRQNWRKVTLAKEKEREGASMYCITCRANYIFENGKLGSEETPKKATDTVTSH